MKIDQKWKYVSSIRTHDELLEIGLAIAGPKSR